LAPGGAGAPRSACFRFGSMVMRYSPDLVASTNSRMTLFPTPSM
jgi:hypothetical protein